MKVLAGETVLIDGVPPEEMRIVLDRELAVNRSILERATWGTEETLYRVKNVAQWIEAARDQAVYATLLCRDQAVATYTVCLKPEPDSAYFGLLAIDPEFPGRGMGKMLGVAVNRYVETHPDRPRFGYSYIERGNARSARIRKGMGHSVLGSFQALLYTPKGRHLRRSPALRLLAPMEKERVVKRLEEFYQDHSLRDFSVSLKPGHYFVSERDGELQAGFQIKPYHWEVLKLGGWSGKLFLAAIDRIPFLARRFPLRDWRFLQIGNLFYRPGQEDLLLSMIDAVLERRGCRNALFYLDPRSRVYADLNHAKAFDLFTAATRSTADVWFCNYRLGPDEVERMRTQPLLISLADP